MAITICRNSQVVGSLSYESLARMLTSVVIDFKKANRAPIECLQFGELDSAVAHYFLEHLALRVKSGQFQTFDTAHYGQQFD